MGPRIYGVVCAMLLVASATAATDPLAVQNLTVLETGQYRAGEINMPVEICPKFRPTVRQVTNWLRQAREVDKMKYYAEGTWSGCRAVGELTLRDGSRHRWYLDAGGIAMIEQEGGALRYFIGEALIL
ncbi:hypothetical protein [Niveispirillum sp. BGYR6]|uniref:hypothetical protein n=1 Tax=Niveispirillum sp. BGYR6 TaxID=2971249 RepID=UPI0022B9BAB5|nr:hypothetical protein [Niveispirillum sp. BGYR6]MDG5496606.1 hypothetical protein [Niveispirillum sp. BGYR6]